MILLPSSAGTVKAPPLITVPTDAVVIDGVWQMLQPIALNSFEPATASGELWLASRGGTFVARMNAANCSTSSSWSWGSGTVSNAATDLPSDVFSVPTSLLVMPISFRYASPENDTRLAC